MLEFLKKLFGKKAKPEEKPVGETPKATEQAPPESPPPPQEEKPKEGGCCSG